MNWLNITNGLMLIGKTADVVSDMRDFQNNNVPSEIKAGTLMTRLSLLGLGIKELFLGSCKESKSAECLIRLLDAPLQLIEGSIKLSDPQLSTAQKINAFGSQILSPHIALFRGCLEHELIKQKEYRDLTPEEQAKLQIPIYEKDADDNQELIGHKPFDLENCLKTIEACEHLIPNLSYTEFFLQTPSLVAPVVAPVVEPVVEYSKDIIFAAVVKRVKVCLKKGKLLGSFSAFCKQQHFNQAVLEYSEDIKKDVLFSCSVTDQNSLISLLPKEIALQVLNLRYQVQLNSLPTYDQFKVLNNF